MDGEAIERAVDACYQAVVQPETWPDALQALADSVGAAGAMFCPRGMNEYLTEVPFSPALRPLLEDYVEKQWWGQYRDERGWPLMRIRPYIIEDDVSTDEERKTLPLYNEFYLRWGYPGFMAVPFLLDGEQWCVPMLRNTKQGFFTREEGEQISKLAPHFRRMMQMSIQIARMRGHAGLEVLDRIDRAAILLDWQGRAVAFNRKAEDLLARASDALFLNGGGHVHAVHPESEQRLRKLFAASRFANRSERRRAEAVPVRIDRNQRRPLMVELISLADLASGILPTASALLLITDLEERRPAKAERLQQMLGLTCAEAKLCVLLSSGMTLTEASEQLGVTEGTVRQRLKEILRKTNTRRQSELVALIGRTAG